MMSSAAAVSHFTSMQEGIVGNGCLGGCVFPWMICLGSPEALLFNMRRLRNHSEHNTPGVCVRVCVCVCVSVHAHAHVWKIGHGEIQFNQATKHRLGRVQKLCLL